MQSIYTCAIIFNICYQVYYYYFLKSWLSYGLWFFFFKGQGLAGLMVVAMSKIGCGWYYASKYRAKLRNQYSLPEEPCSDGAIHFFCCSCALSQEHRELRYRGLDPSLGNQSLFTPIFSNYATSEFKCVCCCYDYFTIKKLN